MSAATPETKPAAAPNPPAPANAPIPPTKAAAPPVTAPEAAHEKLSALLRGDIEGPTDDPVFTELHARIQGLPAANDEQTAFTNLADRVRALARHTGYEPLAAVAPDARLTPLVGYVAQQCVQKNIEVADEAAVEASLGHDQRAELAAMKVAPAQLLPLVNLTLAANQNAAGSALLPLSGSAVSQIIQALLNAGSRGPEALAEVKLGVADLSSSLGHFQHAGQIITGTVPGPALAMAPRAISHDLSPDEMLLVNKLATRFEKHGAAPGAAPHLAALGGGTLLADLVALFQTISALVAANPALLNLILSWITGKPVA